jgi:hypothetical protein
MCNKGKKKWVHINQKRNITAGEEKHPDRTEPPVHRTMNLSLSHVSSKPQESKEKNW